MGTCRSLLILLALILPGAAAAAAADLRPLVLEHLTPEDGLPQGTVMTTLQDSQGFVWLGTEDGLVRFDGFNLVRYAWSRQQPDSLPGNFIWEIAEDARHDLWIAVKDAGVARWNRSSGTFTAWRHDPANPASLASDAVRAVLVDARGRIWIGTSDAGVDILEPTSGHIRHLRHEPANPRSLSSDRVFTFALDPSGDVWVGTQAGLDRWDAGSDGFVHVEAARGHPVSRVLRDQSGSLWVGTFDAGLLRVDDAGHLVESFRHDARRADSLASDDVRAILEDQAGHLWIGTAAGLDLLERPTRGFAHYRHDPGNAESLRDSFIMSLYQDRSGLVWIGTRAGGVSRWNPRSWELGAHRPAWLENQPVTAFADAPDNQIWVASLGGLRRFDAATGAATDLDTLVGRRHALGDERIMSLRLDHLGNLWIGTLTAGLRKLTPEGRLETIPVRPGDAHALSAAAMAVIESRTGQIWVGTFGGGINVIDPATGLIRQLPYGAGVPGAVSAATVTALVEDPRGNLWIGTESGGLDLAKADGTVVEVFRHDTADPTSLPANTIYALTVDSRGRVWVGSDRGLALVEGSSADPASIHFRVISRSDGLSSDNIYGVLPDASGAIWLSSNAGLMRYDPQSGAVRVYHREHGLQGEEFAFGAYYRLRDGRLCFGGQGGFNIFDPQRLTENRQPPRVVLTGVEILGVPAPGPVPYWLRNRIELNHRASIVSLDFGVLDFASPKHNRLAYRMAGLTDQWIDLGTQRRITLTNLDAGKHVLEVRGANSDGVWSVTPLRLQIEKAPAPWRSPWAYTLYALVLLAFIAHRVRMQRRKFQEIVRARERLEAEVQLRTHELVESNRQLAEAARAKSAFLDRMSHELRTPMNGVVGMTELLARTELSTRQARLAQTIRSSAQVLLQIVNDLLDLSKIQAGKVVLERLPLDLTQILEECTSLFAAAAESKGIELIVCPPAREEPRLSGDPLRVRQILMNLVGNAVKFTARGEVVVRADIDPPSGDTAVLRLSVADTGIGMDAETISKIFEPFTQADESTSRRFGGSGLGLAICRELAQLMRGEISVDSRPQVGSTFTLRLPLKVVHDSERQPSPPLPPACVRILTRRPALAESLARHAAAFGLTVLADEPVSTAFAPGAEVVILDASSPDLVQAHLGAPVHSSARTLVVATSTEASANDLDRRVGSENIVSKPVHRAALREALASALGMQPPSEAASVAALRAEPAIGGHILLVEDEPVNAAVAQGYFTELGCTWVWVRDDMEAVARSAAERFDLILMDLSMPNLDGFATARLIRQRGDGTRRVPIVALTAHDAASYRDACLAAGMEDLLTKPYTLEQCAALLRRWIPQSATTQHVIERVPEPVPENTAEPVPGDLASVDARAVAGLRTLRGGQGDLYSRLVDLFRTSSTQSLMQLRSALERADLETASAVCHKLASSAANVGALAFAAQVRELRRLCKAGEANEAREVYGRLQAAHPALLEELLCLRMRATA